MRLFYAVAAGEPVKAAAAAIIARLRALADVRWVDPRDMHVTLRYMGETPESGVAAWRERMEEAAARHAPFELAYGALGAFDSLEDVRVVWLGLDAGRAPLETLSDALGRDEPRPYSPHLTLGRPRRKHVPPAFTAALRAEPPLALRQRVDRVSLYASRPTSFGHAYEILAEAPLRG